MDYLQTFALLSKKKKKNLVWIFETVKQGGNLDSFHIVLHFKKSSLKSNDALPRKAFAIYP